MAEESRTDRCTGMFCSSAADTIRPDTGAADQKKSAHCSVGLRECGRKNYPEAGPEQISDQEQASNQQCTTLQGHEEK